MENFFSELFSYNQHMNSTIIDACKKVREDVPKKTIKLFSHLLNAHHLWNSRIESIEPIFGVWQDHDVRSWKEIDSMNHEKSRYIMQLFDRDTKINYTNTKGNNYDNTVRDILFHVINHSTYHRGQIAMDFRNNELEPVMTDYIFYKR